MVKMGTVEDHTQAKGAHKLTLSNRRTAGITGVSDVISFDISEVLLETDMGMLKIQGADLHVNLPPSGKPAYKADFLRITSALLQFWNIWAS